MSLPQIAIVGRPNVGKSSLFNRIVGRRVSIVDPTPGTTRDRVSQLVEILPPTDLPYDRARDAAPKLAELVDTGGYGVYMAEGGRFDDAGEDLTRLTPEIEAQIRAGVERATLILFVIDAQTGVTGLDERIARLVREAGRADRVLLVANKVDDDSWIGAAQDACRLGFGEPVMTSASSAFGKRAFLEAIWDRLPEWVEPVAPPEMKIAIVGRRNAGKSTLINALAGEPRVIVSEIAGTTRDSIDVRFEMDGHSFVAIDTAGVRKRKSWVDDIEYYSHQRAKAAIERADVCVLLLDAREPVTQVEKRLALELVTQHKPTVIAVNKWDLVQDKLKTSDYIDYLTQELFALDFAPLVFLSAAKGQGVDAVVRVCRNLFGQAHHRETTGRLNAVVQGILDARGPSSKLGTKAKIYYVSQIATNPPTIAIVVNKPELFEGSYERYLRNQLHEQLPFSEVPIKLVFSARKRLTPAELASRKRAGREAGDAADDDAYGD
ncbi:MAG: ribosome biogenesis GTPase Der [Phycisphaera sp.]|nr:ribosome biogenesis GTPase Der [Phycisphaera sp.]